MDLDRQDLTPESGEFDDHWERVLNGELMPGMSGYFRHLPTAPSGAHDFTVLGDPPNTVTRLGTSAMSGELIISRAIAEAAGVDTSTLEERLLELKGKAEPFPVWIETIS